MKTDNERLLELDDVFEMLVSKGLAKEDRDIW